MIVQTEPVQLALFLELRAFTLQLLQKAVDFLAQQPDVATSTPGNCQITDPDSSLTDCFAAEADLVELHIATLASKMQGIGFVVQRCHEAM